VNAPSRIVLQGLLQTFRPEEHGEFRPFFPGVSILPLYGLTPEGKPLDVTQPSAAILRYEPGARVPVHRHRGFEHIFVLEGSQSDEQGTYHRGACLMSSPGTSHSIHSEDGCTVLAIWEKSVEVERG
jgi:hypothetical protein